MSGRRPSALVCWITRRGGHSVTRVYEQEHLEREIMRLYERRIEAHAYLMDEFGSWDRDTQGNRIEVGAVWKDDYRADDGSYWRWMVDKTALADAEGVRG